MARAEEPAVRLITLDPAHFHAALIQKEMYPGVDPTVHVFAPLGPDLLAHLGRVSAFNHRAERPTSWRLEVHAGEDFLERMLREKPGNVVVLSGRNRGKIDRILASVEAGLHVLADKPWIISAADFPKLERALDLADAKGLVAYDVMTERSEITTILQKELAQDPDVAGTIPPGTPQEPAIEMESVHHLMKVVAGAVNLRPYWFFDTAEQGEALGDVATHLVDLTFFTLFPAQAIDHRSQVEVLAARRWPTVLDEAQLLAQRPFSGLVVMQAGIASTIQLASRGFDGHDQLANSYADALPRLTDMVDYIWQKSAEIGIADRVFLRNGMIAFEADKPLADNVRGWAYGIFPTMLVGTADSVYRHEMVHVVQSLQLMAASPEPFLKGHRRDEGKAKFLDFAGFRVQAIGLTNDLTLAKLQSYDKYWREAEAYSLVESL